MTLKFSDGAKYLMQRDGIKFEKAKEQGLIRISRGRWVLTCKGNKKKERTSSHPKKWGLFP